MTINNFIKELKLVDIWTELNPGVKAYSCYSSTHKTFSRIDYFLISVDLLSKIHSCSYDNIVISDHSPCCLVYMDKNLANDPIRWHFQIRWLQDEKFVKYIEEQIDEFFSINTTQTTAGTKWEAFKAFIRGQIISYTCSVSKKAREERMQLEHKIKTLQKKVYAGSNPQVEKELLILRAEYDKKSANRAASSLLRLQQTSYEQGEKSGKLLAWQIKQLETKTAITSIVSDGQAVIDPVEINGAFREYYQALYNTKSEIDLSKLNRFLDGLPIPVIPNEYRETLESEISQGEIGQAIDNLKPGKRA